MLDPDASKAANFAGFPYDVFLNGDTFSEEGFALDGLGAEETDLFMGSEGIGGAMVGDISAMGMGFVAAPIFRFRFISKSPTCSKRKFQKSVIVGTYILVSASTQISDI